MSLLSRWVLLLLLFRLIACGELCYAANELFLELVERGVEISPLETIQLPSPVLTEELDETGQRQAIELLLADRYDWETFTRKSVVSPFLLKIADGQRDVGQIGRQVDLYFVSFGSLDKLSSNDFLQEQLNLAVANDQRPDGDRVKVLSGEELAKRRLVNSQTSDDPRWVAVETTLLGKVRLRVTTQNLKSATADSVLIASAIDPRFEEDPEYSNSWQSISINDAGQRQLGSSQAYVGLGSYIQATRLVEPVGAVFVEYHVAYAEPEGWFGGANLLRSKLPIVAQDLVRKLRRRMSEQSSR